MRRYVSKIRHATDQAPTDRGEIADHIKDAFATSDITVICHAIGDAARLHKISDIARETGTQRSSIYRALSGKKLPNFSTILGVLDPMGFQLMVTPRRGNRPQLGKKRKLAP